MTESKNKNKKKDYAFMCKDCYFIRECPCDCKEPEDPSLFKYQLIQTPWDYIIAKKVFICSVCKHRVYVYKEQKIKKEYSTTG